MEDFGYDYETALKIVKSAKEVNTHHHTKTCKKKVRVGCRFKMPRLPSLHTIIAQVLQEGDMKKEDFENLQRGIFYVKKMVKVIIFILLDLILLQLSFGTDGTIIYWRFKDTAMLKCALVFTLNY